MPVLLPSSGYWRQGRFCRQSSAESQIRIMWHSCDTKVWMNQEDSISYSSLNCSPIMFFNYTCIVYSIFLKVWLAFCQVSNKFSAMQLNSGSAIFTFQNYIFWEDLNFVRDFWWPPLLSFIWMFQFLPITSISPHSLISRMSVKNLSNTFFAYS